MTLQQLAPYHNKLVTYSTKTKKEKGCGIFIDSVPAVDKLFPEDIYFISEVNIDAFRLMADDADFKTIGSKLALKSYGIRVDLSIIESMELKITKDVMVNKWKAAFKDPVFLQAHRLKMRMDEDIQIRVRDITINNEVIRVAPGKIIQFNESDQTMNFHSELSNAEFQELFDLYELYSI